MQSGCYSILPISIVICMIEENALTHGIELSTRTAQGVEQCVDIVFGKCVLEVVNPRGSKYVKSALRVYVPRSKWYERNVLCEQGHLTIARDIHGNDHRIMIMKMLPPSLSNILPREEQALMDVTSTMMKGTAGRTIKFEPDMSNF